MSLKYVAMGFIALAAVSVTHAGATVIAHSVNKTSAGVTTNASSLSQFFTSNDRLVEQRDTSESQQSIPEIQTQPEYVQEIRIDPDAARTSDLLKTAPKVPESASAFVQDYDGEITFKGGQWVYPKTEVAMQRAISSVGDAVSVCVDGKCFNKCDHLAGDIWGYEVASGYKSAATHWSTAKAQGIARLGDREPPLGALLFWDTGRVFGHVATYIGNGMVVTNSGGEFGSDVYVVYADSYERYGWKYLGWADPVFFGEKPGSAL